MGNEESSLSFKVENSILTVNDESVKSIPDDIPNADQIACVDIFKSELKKFPVFPSLTILCVSQTNMNYIPKCIIESLKKSPLISTVDFEFNKIKEVDKSIIESISPKQLILFNNKIKSINLNNTKIMIFDLGMNKLREIPPTSQDVRILKLDYNRISSINNSNNKLKKISLTHNIISKINSSVTFSNVTVFDISYNKLTEMPSFVNMLPKVVILDISHNKLTKLSEIPQSVVTLNACFNELTELPPNFAELDAMRTVSFSDNKISRVGKLPPNLRTLIIFNNNLTKIDENKANSLTKIYLRGNKLTDFPDLCNSTLIDLSLESNCLTGFAIKDYMKQITKIDISNNNITELPDNINELERLQFFTVVNNKLKTIPESIKEIKLVSINLSQNPIETLPQLPMTLERLILIGCNLRSVDFYDEDNEELIELIVSNNFLESVKLLPWFEKVDLSNNSFREFPEINESLEYLDLSCNNIAIIPHEIESSRLKYLDLSDNFITDFDHYIPSLEILKLSFNFSLKLTLNENYQNHLKKLEIANIYEILKSTDFKIRNTLSTMNGPGNILHRFDNNNAGFALIKGDISLSEDVATMVKDMKNGMHMIVLVDGSNSLDSASIAVRTAIKVFNEEKIKTEKRGVDVLSSKVVRFIEEKRHFQIRELCFTFIERSTITINTVGFMTVYIVTYNGNIRKVFRKDDKSEFGPLSVYDEITESIVFNKANIVQSFKYDIVDGDKWIVVASSAFHKQMPKDIFKCIAEKSTNVADFTYYLRNLVFSYGTDHNISVAIADLTCLFN